MQISILKGQTKQTNCPNCVKNNENTEVWKSSVLRAKEEEHAACYQKASACYG